MPDNLPEGNPPKRKQFGADDFVRDLALVQEVLQEREYVIERNDQGIPTRVDRISSVDERGNIKLSVNVLLDKPAEFIHFKLKTGDEDTDA